MPELEHALRELGRELAWPPEPDVAATVRERLGGPARPRPRRRGLALAFAAVGAALAVALAVPPARSAILDFLRIGGAKVERVETLPQLRPGTSVPGVPATLEEARAALPFTPAEPPGEPERILLDRGAGWVTFVYPDRLLSAFRGDELLLKKAVEAGTRTEWVAVGGAAALWIEGAEHAVFLPGGEARLAGNVLLWVRDGVTYRLEGDLTRAEALRFAGTLGASGT